MKIDVLTNFFLQINFFQKKVKFLQISGKIKDLLDPFYV